MRRNGPSAGHRTQCQGTAGAVKQTRERPQYGTQAADSHPWRELPDLMNLQHLRYLVGFSEHRTLTDAADSLGISQPAISRALHEQIGRATSELQSLMRISYAVFCLKKKKHTMMLHYSRYIMSLRIQLVDNTKK